MLSEPKSYHVLGLMSGSSLDGLDIAFVRFSVAENKLDWELISASTIPFDKPWRIRLKELPRLDSIALYKTHADFGHYTAELVNQFIEKRKVKADFIASHGHTVFHNPSEGFTTQIGDGAALAVDTGLPVICDFRTHDVALRGEGAPLAPIADRHLFPGYDFYLNLGGIANITALHQKKVIAFDICPANQVLNYLSGEMDLEFDARGVIAQAGKPISKLLDNLEGMDYYQKKYPKTLDNNWIHDTVFPIYDQHRGSTKDKLHTACKHIANEISRSIELVTQNEGMNKRELQLFITGGGGFNDFLVECIEQVCKERHQIKIVLPSPDIIAFKEALLIALMGVLRVENRINCLSSATGAIRDSIAGAIYQGTKKLL